MSWKSGSSLASELIESIKENVALKDARTLVYFDLIEIFEAADYDTLEDCLGIDHAFDDAYNNYFNTPCAGCGDPECDFDCDGEYY